MTDNSIKQNAFNKVKKSTIPSRFETVIIKSQSQAKAFGTSSDRFGSLYTDIPGPGAYSTVSEASVAEFENELNQNKVVSKKGLGNGFASSTDRFKSNLHYPNTGPGPGSYQFISLSEKIQKEKERLSPQFIPTQTEVKQEKEQIEPGPGSYNPKLIQTQNYNTFSIMSSMFASGTQRSENFDKYDNPAPGQYNIKRDLPKLKPYKHNGSTSSFASPMKQRIKDDPISKGFQIKNMEENQKPSLGPGYYFQGDDKPKSNAQLTYSSYFLQGNVDRFGNLKIPKSPSHQQIPGPGHYLSNQTEQSKSTKALVSGSAFMSETLRYSYANHKNNELGPGTYVAPIPLKKQNFHFNVKKIWA